MNYYLVFGVNYIPDLSLTKYSVYDISCQEDLIEKHNIFLRQLHRLGVMSQVYFHLLYYFDCDSSIPRGKRLKILFYATADTPDKLAVLPPFITSSVLSTYYDFKCFGQEPRNDEYIIDEFGRWGRAKDEFNHGAFLCKKDYHLYAQNRLPYDEKDKAIPIWSMMEWTPNEVGRLFNVLKLMEGYDETAAIRVDLFPVDVAENFSRNMLPVINDLHSRMSQHNQGRDNSSATILKSIEAFTDKLMKYPQFCANIVAFSKHKDVAIMLADSIGAEAVESGAYKVHALNIYTDKSSYNIYSFDNIILLLDSNDKSNYMADHVSLYTLDEIRPMFSLPVLYPGESIECPKESDPPYESDQNISGNESSKGHSDKYMLIGRNMHDYPVSFPIDSFSKHAFIAGVPGSGKTNTMLFMTTELWCKHNIPFLVFEPAKQEYRSLAKISKLKEHERLKELRIFSPGADTRFPLHINPFEFPKGLTLAEHIANLNAVFAGAFELPPPSPHFIDTCIEKVYMDKGWNINSRNDEQNLPYPTLQELYDSLNIAVQNSHYQGETLGNLRSVMEVRVGSLLKREIGNVYNVRHSTIKPEDWLKYPIIIELESLGEGPANFMTLLISTLIRESLKVRKIQNHFLNHDIATLNEGRKVNHIVFYEEAHNLIGPSQEQIGDSVDPKISATKYLVKMLAEVRALKEGIVIADQLPTVMAPEVLKNTELKLAHRITASDDRELLGNTMSASPDQLAEQGTYKKGEALVFYEDLLKPFKIKVRKWQLENTHYESLMTAEMNKYLTDNQFNMQKYFDNIYDSPTDSELVSLIGQYDSYDEMLKRSALIMVQKMREGFRALRSTILQLYINHLIEAHKERENLLQDIHYAIREYDAYRVNACDPNDASGHQKKNEIRSKFDNFEKQLSYKGSPYSIYMTLSDKNKTNANDKLRKLLSECCMLFMNNVSSFENYGKYSEFVLNATISSFVRTIGVVNYKHIHGCEVLNAINYIFRTVKTFINKYGKEFAYPLSDCSLNHNYEMVKNRLSMILIDLACDTSFLHKELYDFVKIYDFKNSPDKLYATIKAWNNFYFKWNNIVYNYHGIYSDYLKMEMIDSYLGVFNIILPLDDYIRISKIFINSSKSIYDDIMQFIAHIDSSNNIQCIHNKLYRSIKKRSRVINMIKMNYEFNEVLEATRMDTEEYRTTNPNKLTLRYEAYAEACRMLFKKWNIILNDSEKRELQHWFCEFIIIIASYKHLTTHQNEMIRKRLSEYYRFFCSCTSADDRLLDISIINKVDEYFNEPK